MRQNRFLLAGCLAAVLSMPTQAVAAQHVFDLDAHMPPHLAFPFTMAWFGVSTNDPQGGDDPDYGNWKQNFPACGLMNDPSACVDFQGAGLQRSIASRRRPLAGIYSATGRSPDSLARIDLMLSTERRPCDDGAKFDSFAVQIDSVKFTSAYPNNKQSKVWDYAWRATNAFLERADAAGMDGGVVVGIDATIYWHFGSNFGLMTQSDRMTALTDDLTDMAKLAVAHPGALSLDGRPLLAMYVDAPLMTPTEWQTVLDGARQASGIDFYALGMTLKSSFFAAFDALVPWVNLGMWANTSGATLRDHAYEWQKTEHADLVANVGNYPGRVVFGALTPGFDDYTENWGQCTMREIPRDPDVLAGEFDYLKDLKATLDVRGLLLETWDDWTEGTEFEPDVTEGPAKLVQVRQGIGDFFGEAPDAAGGMALSDRWTGWGQPKNCCFAGGACPPPPAPIDLVCGSTGSGGASGGSTSGSATGGTSPAGVGGSATTGGPSGATGGGGGGPNATPGNAESGGGCGCGVVGTERSRAAWIAALALLMTAAQRAGARRRSRRRA